MYWIVTSLFFTLETNLSFILTWIPLYPWLRFFLHIYLILPGQQGATHIYQTYVHPFLVEHEGDIDRYISEGHDKAKALGLQYMKAAIDWVKVNILGMPPKAPTPPPSRQGSYAQQLLSRFNLPSAREGLAAPAGDFYALLASALQMAYTSTSSREAAVEDLSASGTLIPQDIRTYDEKMTYVSQQREKLRVLLQAFDKEAFMLAGQDEQSNRPASGLSKSRSEADFEKLSVDELAGQSSDNAGKPGSPIATGSWMPWNWGGKPVPEDTGKSSGVDTGR